MSIAVQVEAQRQGLIAIVYFMGDFQKRNDFHQVRKRVQRLRSVVPIKMAAGHVCTDDPRMRFLLRVVRPWLNLYTLTRIRFHSGMCSPSIRCNSRCLESTLTVETSHCRTSHGSAICIIYLRHTCGRIAR